MSDGQDDIQEKLTGIRVALDMELVGDNISDIAAFTVEKFEFRTESTLSAETREAAIGEIKNLLWRRVEQLKERRRQILADMFNAAEAKLAEVIERDKRSSTKRPVG
jgi:hypothetical protein